MISTEIDPDNSIVKINLPENFDFRIHREFRAAYEQSGDEHSQFVINLENTKYMDSSALGMLLLLREFTGNEPETAKIKIINVRDDVRDILRISKFEKLFQIE